ncbi:hypothetical protein FACS1894190_07010 [Spirochaetia bacterium]|nr:hypothetical protein FACS1894190_07010 [Spirochaetia bacterium]GHV21133.1 hypothetical protein FACS189494_06060 [Spirochaetia bacterium]
MKAEENEKMPDDIIYTYMKQVRMIPLLDAEKERSLALRIQSGDKIAKQKLVEANLRLVVKISMSYRCHDVALMDIIQEGNIGLMRAAGKFAVEKNVRFSTYSSFWIKQSIRRFLESKTRMIHIPIQKEELLRKIRDAEHSLSQILGRDPRTEEIAEKIGCAIEDVERLRNAVSSVSLDSALDANVEEAEIVTFGELYADPRQLNPEEEFIQNYSAGEARNFLRRCLNTKERGVIMQRFRFVPGETHSLQKIGDKMGLSAEAVRQIEKKALNKISKERDELAACVYA